MGAIDAGWRVNCLGEQRIFHEIQGRRQNTADNGAPKNEEWRELGNGDRKRRDKSQKSRGEEDDNLLSTAADDGGRAIRLLPRALRPSAPRGKVRRLVSDCHWPASR